MHEEMYYSYILLREKLVSGSEVAACLFSLSLSLSLIKHNTAQKQARKTRGELAKLVDADYYGYRDEDDGIIVPLEREREEEGKHSPLSNHICHSVTLHWYAAVAEAVKEWQSLKEQGKLEGDDEEEEDIYAEARMIDVSLTTMLL